MEASLETVTRTASSTKFYIFNLYADYILPTNQGKAWTNDLIYLLDLVDLSERAARTTLSRMKQQGWFKTTRQGRRSCYELTPQGKVIIAEGDQRIFEPALTDWNGRWQMVVYSLPEEKRALRNELRKKLEWFGFGNLAPGTWISAHNRQSELKLIVEELGVRENVLLCMVENAGVMKDAEIVQRCWNLDDLAAEYAHFVARWQPEYEQYQSAAVLSPEQRFTKRFWLTFDFQPFPRKDPNLPAELLPKNWIGHTARELFTHFREVLNEGLPSFFTNLLCK
jgi:phenylacetic acid degradation operon negative regulatory protein